MKRLPDVLKVFDEYYKHNPLEIESVSEGEFIEEKIEKEKIKFFIIKSVRHNQNPEYVGRYAITKGTKYTKKIDTPALIGRGEEDYQVTRNKYRILIQEPFNDLKWFFDFQLKKIEISDVPEEIRKQLEENWSKLKTEKQLAREEREKEYRLSAKRAKEIKKDVEVDPTKYSKYKAFKKELEGLKFEAQFIVDDAKKTLGMLDVWKKYNEEVIQKTGKTNIRAVRMIALLREEIKKLDVRIHEWAEEKFEYVWRRMYRAIDDIFTEEMINKLLDELGFREIFHTLRIELEGKPTGTPKKIRKKWQKRIKRR